MTREERHDVIAAASSELWEHHETLRRKVASVNTLDVSEPAALGARVLRYSNVDSANEALAKIRAARAALAALKESPVADVEAAIRKIMATMPITVEDLVLVVEESAEEVEV